MIANRKICLKKTGKIGVKMIIAGVPFAIIFSILDYVCAYNQMYLLRTVLAWIACILIFGGLITVIANIKILKARKVMVDPYLDRIKIIQIKGECYKNKKDLTKEQFVLNYEAMIREYEDFYRIIVDSHVLGDDYCGKIEEFELFDDNGNIVPLNNYYFEIDTHLSDVEMNDINIYPKFGVEKYKLIFPKAD